MELRKLAKRTGRLGNDLSPRRARYSVSGRRQNFATCMQYHDVIKLLTLQESTQSKRQISVGPLNWSTRSVCRQHKTARFETRGQRTVYYSCLCLSSLRISHIALLCFCKVLLSNTHINICTVYYICKFLVNQILSTFCAVRTFCV